MKTVKEIWINLFDSSLECYKNEDEAVRNLSMILHVLKLEFEKAGALILELKQKNKSPTTEISECQLGSAQLCGCKSKTNSRKPLKPINSHYNETTPKKKTRTSTSFDLSDSEDLLNHQITDLDVNLSKENDNSLFIDKSDEDFNITTSPTLTKHKSNRLSRSRKENVKNSSFKDLIVMNTPTPKINRSKKFKQTKSKLSSLNYKTNPQNFTVTKTDYTNIYNCTDNDETLFIPAPAQQKNVSNEKVPTDTEVREILEDLKESALSQNKRIKLDNSYDCIPEIEHDDSPDFVYKREAVRKKSERMKLQGWECQDCEKYYATYQNKLTAEELKKKMDQCSRHRDKFNPNILTPKGFWNPEFSPTQNSGSLI